MTTGYPLMGRSMQVPDCFFPRGSPAAAGRLNLPLLLIAAGSAAAGTVTAAAAAASPAGGTEGKSCTNGHGCQQQPVKGAHYKSPAMV